MASFDIQVDATMRLSPFVAGDQLLAFQGDCALPQFPTSQPADPVTSGSITLVDSRVECIACSLPTVVTSSRSVMFRDVYVKGFLRPAVVNNQTTSLPGWTSTAWTRVGILAMGAPGASFKAKLADGTTAELQQVSHIFKAGVAIDYGNNSFSADIEHNAASPTRGWVAQHIFHDTSEQQVGSCVSPNFG
jgi:hypothetical protein